MPIESAIGRVNNNNLGLFLPPTKYSNSTLTDQMRQYDNNLSTKGSDNATLQRKFRTIQDKVNNLKYELSQQDNKNMVEGGGWDSRKKNKYKPYVHSTCWSTPYLW